MEKITGHMMITEGKIPDELELEIAETKNYFVFECSFDFYDSTLNMGIYLDDLQPIGGIWVTPQNENAKKPDKSWVEFFVQTVFEHINDDGDFGIPMYVYLNDTADFAVVPMLDVE